MPQSKPKVAKLERSLDGNAIGVLRENSSALLLRDSDSEILYSLFGCVEDDSQNWSDFQLDWPRSVASADAVESIDELDWEELAPEDLIAEFVQREKTPATANWLLIDIPHATVLSGSRGPKISLAADSGQLPSNGDSHATAELEIAPWWTVDPNANAEKLLGYRKEKPQRRTPNRKILWGDEWLEYLANELTKVAKSGAHLSSEQAYPVIFKIHKAWLLTPRASLSNQTPREQLHIAKDWISHLHSTQRSRVEEGLDPIPLPQSFSGYPNAPLGKHEVILYFDATRELLEYGYNWMVKNVSSRKSKKFASELSDAISKRLRRWLNESDEDGLTPAMVIQFERQRLPLMPLEVGHPEVCNCPICMVMASGALGQGYIFYDGHQLELDGEFAFSLCATQQEWEQDYGVGDEDGFDDNFDEDFDETMEGSIKEGVGKGFGEADGTNMPDDLMEFGSRIWNTQTPEEIQLPQSLKAKLGLAFLFAEFMSELESHSHSRQKFHEDSERLALRFAHFTMAVQTHNRSKAKPEADAIKLSLEAFATEFPALIPRVADLTSRLDEELRACTK